MRKCSTILESLTTLFFSVQVQYLYKQNVSFGFIETGAGFETMTEAPPVCCSDKVS